MTSLMRIVRGLFALGGGRRDGGTLIVQPLPGIGDMIWHLPHIHSIAAADGAAVTVLTKPRSRADRLFIADVAVEDVMWLERNPGRHSGLLGIWRLAREIRQRRFAQAWLLHGSSRYALALLLAGIPRTTGYGRGAQRWLLSDPVFLPPTRTHGHPIALADELLRVHGIPFTELAPRLVVDKGATRWIETEFSQHPGTWIALGIGCSEPSRQWAPANFEALARGILKAHTVTVFLVGGDAETAIATQIRQNLPAWSNQVVIFTKHSLEESAALLARCRLCVANETGVFNVSAAVGTPTIGLIVTDWEPPWTMNMLCIRPSGGGTSVADIAVETVGGAVEEWLGQR